MAELVAYNVTSGSISYKITGLDPTYNESIRHVEWYFKESSVSGDYWTLVYETDIPAELGIEEHNGPTQYGLSKSTSYDAFCIIFNIVGSMNVYLGPITTTTTEVGGGESSGDPTIIGYTSNIVQFFNLQVINLDTSYQYSGRKFECEIRKSQTDTWYIPYPSYSGSIKAGVNSTDVSSSIAEIRDADGNKICDIEPNTSYDIRITISNIKDYPDKILYHTVLSGSTEMPTPIFSTAKAYQKSVNELSITYVCTFQKDSIFEVSRSRRTDLWIYCDDKVVELIEGVDNSYSVSFFVDEGKTYNVKFVAINYYFYNDEDDGITRSATSETIVVTVVDLKKKPECTLPVTWKVNYTLNKDNFTPLNNQNHTLLCYKYPYILASDWNAFCADINAVRVKGGLPQYGAFISVNPGDSLTCDVFNHAYYAINAIYDELEVQTGASKPINFTGVKQYHQITKDNFNGLVSAIQTMRDYLWT